MKIWPEPDNSPDTGDWLRAERVSGYNVMQFNILRGQEHIKTMPSFLTLPACYRIVTPCSNYPMD